MKHRITPYAASALITLLLFPFRAGADPQQELLAQLQRMDTNHDQKLSYAEIAEGFQARVPRLVEQFKQADRNGDGVVDRSELSPLLFNRFDLDGSGKIYPEEYYVAESAKARDFVVKADRNRDGQITLEEFNRGLQTAAAETGFTYDEMARAYSQNGARRKQLFDAIDSDKNGWITSEEWPHPPSFSNIDKSRDGRIGFFEFMGAHYSITRQLVVAADLNRDGRVTYAEVTQGMQRLAAAQAGR
jgi:Ca2+-binding EF-hand superfamily protein